MSNLIPRLEFIFQSFFKTQKCCPYCKEKNLKLTATKNFFIKIQECESCNLYFTDPIYKPWLLSSLYDNLYAAEGSTTTMPTTSELEKLKETSFDNSDKCFLERLKIIKDKFGTGKLLEFGSSWGYFLYQAKHFGYDAKGIEISDPRRNFGINNLRVSIFKSLHEIPDEDFNIIYTAHTLEHLTDLSNIFSDFSRLLSENGKLLIEVPNCDFSTPGKNPLNLIGAVHPLGFSKAFFEKNLPKYGFQNVDVFKNWKDLSVSGQDNQDEGNIIVVASKT